MCFSKNCEFLVRREEIKEEKIEEINDNFFVVETHVIVPRAQPSDLM